MLVDPRKDLDPSGPHDKAERKNQSLNVEFHRIPLDAMERRIAGFMILVDLATNRYV